MHAFLRSDALGEPEANVYLERACELDAMWCVRLGLELTEEGDFVRGREAYAQACERGIWRQCVSIGHSYLKEEPVDVALAQHYFEVGCDADEPRSCAFLAIAYERRWIEGGSPELVFALNERGCMHGYHLACTNLAINLITRARDGDEARAISLFERMCAQGSSTSCADLGDRLVQGRGLQRDVSRGLSLLSRSCDADDAYGCAYYGRALFREAQAAADIEVAWKAMRRACDDGSARGCLFAADRGLDDSVSVPPEEVSALYARSLELFLARCREDRDGRSCGLAAGLIGDGHVEPPDDLSEDELRRLGCLYDRRVCEWE